jgi:uncharacterized protein (TIGR00255 family)
LAHETYRLNEAVLAGYLRQLEQIRRQSQLDGPLQLEQLLGLPGVVDERSAFPLDADAIWPVVELAIRQALDGLARMRQEEGRAMASDLAENCRAIAVELEAVERLAPRVVESYRQRLTEKLSKLLDEYSVTVQVGDVVREVGLFAERSDISEELVRLRSHLEQFVSIMAAGESNGRKLEFVTQEMFREANTIGSKSNDAEIARHVIEIKSGIERIREMIQNVE